MKHSKKHNMEEVMRGGKKMSPMQAKAKSKVLEELSDDMMGMSGDKLKKVTVASDSPKGLKKGLEMAKNVLPTIEDKMGDYNSEESPEHEGMESEGEELAEHKSGMEEKEPEEMTADELEMEIAKLEELLKEKKMEA